MAQHSDGARNNGPSFVASLLVILGVLAGVTYYLATSDGGVSATPADPTGTAAPSRSAPTAPSTSPVTARSSAPVDRDPLDIPVPFENQPCSGDYVVILATAGMAEPTPPQVRLPDVASGHPRAKYLHNRESCPSAFMQNAPDGEIYQLYLGAFGDIEDACAARRTGAPATWLKRLGDPSVVYCICAEPARSLPTLTVGPLDESNRFRVSDVQQLLDTRRLNPQRRIHGNFDDTFREQLMNYQRLSGIPATGQLDPRTWRAVRDEAC